jgi:hypothetical protein
MATVMATVNFRHPRSVNLSRLQGSAHNLDTVGVTGSNPVASISWGANKIKGFRDSKRFLKAPLLSISGKKMGCLGLFG